MKEELFDSLILSKTTPEEIVTKMGGECNCLKCIHGCKFGSGTFKKGEEKKLAKFLKVSEKELEENYLEEIERFNTKLKRPKILREKGKPYGPCIFLNSKEGKCKIYKLRPLQCKISTCKDYGVQMDSWFVLNHFVNPENEQSLREYITYLKFKKTIPGGRLGEVIKDKEKLKKILNFGGENKNDR